MNIVFPCLTFDLFLYTGHATQTVSRLSYRLCLAPPGCISLWVEKVPGHT
jgi:hypothetical protein